MTELSHPRPARPNSAGLRLWPVLVPAFLLVAIGNFSPNWTHREYSLRTDPYGGDFLQEYTGGRLILDEQRRKDLYDLETFRAVQHDPALTGFAWDEKKFFPPVYPPFWYAAVSPLSRLDYQTAARLWLILTTACLAGSLGLLARHRLSPLLLAGLCFSTPVLISLTSGQKGTCLLLIMTLSWMGMLYGRPVTSGAIFGLIALKPHLGLPIGLAMLVAHQWRWLAGFAGTLVVLLMVSLLGGWTNCEGYLGVCLGFGDYLQNSGYRLEQGFSLWSMWQLMFSDPVTAKIATAISSIAILAVTFRTLGRCQRDHRIPLDRAVSALVLLTVVISPHLYVYDLTLLILPAALLLRRAMNHPARFEEWVPVVAIVLILFASPWFSRWAMVTGFQLGTVLLVAALATLLYSIRRDHSPETDGESLPALMPATIKSQRQHTQ